MSDKATKSKNWLNVFLVFALCLLVRLIPLRAPNVEPILASQMPAAKRYGALFGMFFGFSSVILYDVLTNTLGTWTYFTGLAYGILGAAAFYFFKKFKESRKNYILFAVLGTFFFDALTGLTVGPLFFGQSLFTAFWGQIPFTVWHLAGNTLLAYFLSPALRKFYELNLNKNLFIINNYSFKSSYEAQN